MPKGNCDICGMPSDELEPMIYHNDDTQMLCWKCWEQESNRIDEEYERWVENQEQDFKEEDFT